MYCVWPTTVLSYASRSYINFVLICFLKKAENVLWTLGPWVVCAAGITALSQVLSGGPSLCFLTPLAPSLWVQRGVPIPPRPAPHTSSTSECKQLRVHLCPSPEQTTKAVTRMKLWASLQLVIFLNVPSNPDLHSACLPCCICSITISTIYCASGTKSPATHLRWQNKGETWLSKGYFSIQLDIEICHKSETRLYCMSQFLSNSLSYLSAILQFLQTHLKDFNLQLLKMEETLDICRGIRKESAICGSMTSTFRSIQMWRVRPWTFPHSVCNMLLWLRESLCKEYTGKN